MSRKPNLIPSLLLNVALPLPLHTQLTVHLYSDLEQRVPHGAYSRWLAERVREYFHNERLDLAPYLNCAAGAFIVEGTPEAIYALKEVLNA